MYVRLITNILANYTLQFATNYNPNLPINVNVQTHTHTHILVACLCGDPFFNLSGDIHVCQII